MSMRPLAAVLVVLGTASLSGCIWWTDSGTSSNDQSSSDAEFPMVLLGILVLAGVILLVVNLSNEGGSTQHPPPSPPGAPQQGWQEVETANAPPPKVASRPDAKPKPRRRAP